MLKCRSVFLLLLVVVVTQSVVTVAFLTTTPFLLPEIHRRFNHHHIGVAADKMRTMKKKRRGLIIVQLASSSSSSSVPNPKHNKHTTQQTSSSSSYKDGPASIRIVRCIPNLSRRQAEQAILLGRVKVDGVQVKPSYRLVPGQTLTLDNKIIHWESKAADMSLLNAEQQKHAHFSTTSNKKSKSQERLSSSKSSFVYYKYHKPVGVTCTMDKYDRRGLFYTLPSKIRKKDNKLFPVGRLDLDSEGLLLLTNDGQLADIMLQPKFEHTKEYIVEIQPKLSLQQLEELSMGVIITTVQQRGGQTTTKPTKPCIVEEVPSSSSSSVLSRHNNKKMRNFSSSSSNPSSSFAMQNNNNNNKQLLRFVLSEGRNRQIRKMVEVMGSNVISLRRIRHGIVSLGKLSSGSIHPLQDDELDQLLALKRRSQMSNRNKHQTNRPRKNYGQRRPGSKDTWNRDSRKTRRRDQLHP